MMETCAESCWISTASSTSATSRCPAPPGSSTGSRARASRYRYLTNTTSRPRRAIVDKLTGMGIPAAADQVLTPAVAAVAWLRRHGIERPALFVPEATATEFAELDPLPDGADDGAGAVVVGDLGEGWDFATLNRAFRLLMSDAAPPLVALGMTRYWRAEDGLRLDAGAVRAGAGVRRRAHRGRPRQARSGVLRHRGRGPRPASRARWSWSATTSAPTSRAHSGPA